MDRADSNDPQVARHLPSGDITKLIRKLRWIGLEDDARRLQRIASMLPPEERSTVSVGPFATD